MSLPTGPRAAEAELSPATHAPTRRGPWPRLLLTWPGAALLVLFVFPLLVIVAVSFFRRVQTAFFEVGFVGQNYANALTPFYLDRLWVSVAIALVASLVCLLVGLPFTYLLTRLPRRRQVPYLVLVLASLSLSEVIVAFSWSLMLSRTSGVSNLLVWLGLLDTPQAWSPGLAAVLLALVFIALPLTVLTFYPTVSRLEPELMEAATTMGASPLRGFVTVVLPLLRRAVAGAFALVFIYVLGAYVIPQTLGRPAQWTFPVHITDQAVLKSNLPLAAALAVVLLLATAVVAGVILALSSGRRRGAA